MKKYIYVIGLLLCSAGLRAATCTPTGRLLWTHRVQDVKNGENDYHWDGKDLKSAPLANGLYRYTATLERNGSQVTRASNLFIVK